MDYLRPLSNTMADQPTIRLATPEGKCIDLKASERVAHTHPN